jgi:hypothetical protein
MASDHSSEQANSSYHSLHLTPEELAHLPPDELLQAYLEFRSLLHTSQGFSTPPKSALQ